MCLNANRTKTVISNVLVAFYNRQKDRLELSIEHRAQTGIKSINCFDSIATDTVEHFSFAAH